MLISFNYVYLLIMFTYRITYKDKKGKLQTEIVQADHGAEAQEIAEEDFPDLKEITKVEQL